jgi:hypothetical protein
MNFSSTLDLGDITIVPSAEKIFGNALEVVRLKGHAKP